MVQNKIQIEEKDLEFIKKAYKTLSYRSLSHYMREAVQTKVREDRKKLKALQRSAAMETVLQAWRGKTLKIGDIVWVNLDPALGDEIRKKRPSTVFKSGPSATRGFWTGWVPSLH